MQGNEQRGRGCPITTFADKDRIGDRWRVRNTYMHAGQNGVEKSHPGSQCT